MKSSLFGIIGVATLLVACGGGESTAPSAEDVAMAEEALSAGGPDGWNLVLADSSIDFSGMAYGQTITGSFTRFDAAVTYDGDMADATIEAVIDMTSITSPSSDARGTLPAADWFDIATFPEARFMSDTISATGAPDSYQAIGTVTIKGVTEPASIDFTLTEDGDQLVANGSLSLDREPFGIGGSGSEFGDAASITLVITLMPAE